MEFTKIKDDGAQVTLRWTTSAGDDAITHELTSFDRPHPDFLAAMRTIVPEVVALLGLPSDYSVDMRVSSVSLNYPEDNMGAVVTCLKKLTCADSPLVLNTPNLPEIATREGGPCLPSVLVRRIEALCKEAEGYVEGKREQGDMFQQEAA